MNTVKIPDGHQAIMPYLILKGASAFQNFVIEVFNGSITSSHKRPDSDVIMHAEASVNGSTIMFAESTDDYPPATANLFAYVADADDTYKKALQQGATSISGPEDKEYGRTCGVTDPCGNVWWITSLS